MLLSLIVIAGKTIAPVPAGASVISALEGAIIVDVGIQNVQYGITNSISSEENK